MDVQFSDLTGTVAAITGGGVLCSTIARGMFRQDVRIAVLDVRVEAAQAVAHGICAAGGTAIPVQCDVLDSNSIGAACAEILAAYGRIDILVNGAGGYKREATTDDRLSFFDMPSDVSRWVYELNLLGTVLPCQVFGRHLSTRGNRCIRNISSMAAFRPLTRTVAYSVAKAAVSNFTLWLAVYVSPNCQSRIRDNALASGFSYTEQNRFLLFDRETGDLTQRGHNILDHTPLGRCGDPEGLVPAALWLVSEAASVVHGAVIPVDGGFLAFAGV
jgi:NAD(P)-dependent dehydrogenase (short-subunit alcohol dehydrogenase family)